MKEQGKVCAHRIGSECKAKIGSRTSILRLDVAAFQIVIVANALIPFNPRLHLKERFRCAGFRLIESIDIPLLLQGIAAPNLLPIGHAMHDNIEKCHIIRLLSVTHDSV